MVVLAAPDTLVPADAWPADHDLSCGDRSSNTLAAMPAACPTLCVIDADSNRMWDSSNGRMQLLGWDGHHNDKWLASCWPRYNRYVAAGGRRIIHGARFIYYGWKLANEQSSTPDIGAAHPRYHRSDVMRITLCTPHVSSQHTAAVGACPTVESIILANGECILQSPLLNALLHLQGKSCFQVRTAVTSNLPCRCRLSAHDTSGQKPTAGGHTSFSVMASPNPVVSISRYRRAYTIHMRHSCSWCGPSIQHAYGISNMRSGPSIPNASRTTLYVDKSGIMHVLHHVTALSADYGDCIARQRSLLIMKVSFERFVCNC